VCPTRAGPRACTPTAAPGASRPAPPHRHFSAQARSQLATLRNGLVLKAERSLLLVLLTHCLLSSNGDPPRPRAQLAFLGGRLPFCQQPSAAWRRAALTLGHLLQCRLSLASRVFSALHRRSPVHVHLFKVRIHANRPPSASSALRRARARAARDSCRAFPTCPPVAPLPRVARFLPAPPPVPRSPSRASAAPL
jgi:hypothetical protein